MLNVHYNVDPVLSNVILKISHCLHGDISRIPNKKRIVCSLALGSNNTVSK